jgi:cation diffusion facilitator family transporter
MKNVDKGIRVTILGIIINFLLAIIKITAGVFGTSYALISDGIESTTDIFSSIIVYSGLKIASKPPDDNHPYGHGKAEAIAAMIVAMLLFGAAAMIIYNSIHEIITPHHAPASFTLIVLIGVVVIKELLFKKVFNVGNKIDSTAVQTDAWHHRSDAITSAACFIGISISLIKGAGYESADDYAALFACSIIIFNASRLLIKALADVMDETPSGDFRFNVISVIENVNGISGISRIKIRKSGLQYLVDVNIKIDGNLSIIKGHEISEDVSEALKNSNLSIGSVMVHIEPNQI